MRDGGSCFPKDTLALIKTAQDNASPLRIIETVVAANDGRKRGMFRKVATALGGRLRGRLIAVLGLTFKPNTDDMRDAPSISLITALTDKGASIRVYDPVGMEHAKQYLPDVAFACDPYACAEAADALVIMTEWEQFRALDLKRLKQVMNTPVLVDLRNIYQADEVRRHGFAYESVGRPSQQQLKIDNCFFDSIAFAPGRKMRVMVTSRRAAMRPKEHSPTGADDSFRA